MATPTKKLDDTIRIDGDITANKETNTENDTEKTKVKVEDFANEIEKCLIEKKEIIGKFEKLTETDILNITANEDEHFFLLDKELYFLLSISLYYLSLL